MSIVTTCTIRPAMAVEVDALVANILAMARESEGRDLDPSVLKAGIQSVLDNPALGTYWVAVDAAGRILANTMITVEWSDWNNVPYWWIQSLYIVPDCRGQGLFERLLETLEDVARRERVKEIRLYVEENNARAIRAYQRNGFESGHYRTMIRDLD